MQPLDNKKTGQCGFALGIIVLVLIAACYLPVVGQTAERSNISLGIGWRVLNYAKLRLPLTFTTDLRWIGVRLRLGNNYLGGGFALGQYPFPFVEGISAISSLFTSKYFLYLTVGATLFNRPIANLWPLSSEWNMLPWIGLEADLFLWAWIHTTFKIEIYIPRNLTPDEVGVGIILYLFPF